MHLMVRPARQTRSSSFRSADAVRTLIQQGACYLYDNWHLRHVDKTARFRILFVWKCVSLTLALATAFSLTLLTPSLHHPVTSRSLAVIAAGSFLMVAGVSLSRSGAVFARCILLEGGRTPRLKPDSSVVILLSRADVRKRRRHQERPEGGRYPTFHVRRQLVAPSPPPPGDPE
jgi:hypothetical protein